MKKTIITLIIISFMNLIGCYSYHTISKEELDQAEEYRDLQVITKNKYIYEFDEGNYTISEDSIYGTGNLKLVTGKKVYKDYEGSIKFEDVAKLKMEKFDVVSTILVVAIPVVIIVIAAGNFSLLGGDSLNLE
ncbi:MAG: hypothetical protein IH618_08165 [Ignavibacteriaceae bacterium]|nr:hypothetical protein [Ignavibacteriaceae bacterium]